jgi:hypothetical protein
MYKSFVRKEIQSENDKSSVFTFTLNTDGISPCSKSDISIWPIYLVINELPINLRFCYDHVIIAGLSVSHGKPNLEPLTVPIIQELKLFELGHVIKVNNISRLFRFFCLCGVFDKPARADILNTNNSTGFSSCLKCYEKGQSVRTEKGKFFPFNFFLIYVFRLKLFIKKGGTVITFVYKKTKVIETRDHANYLIDLRNSMIEKKRSMESKARVSCLI